MKKFLTILICVFMLFSVTACTGDEGGKDDGPIVVGCLQDLTGPTSSLGKSVLKGVEDAIADINANGGINGREVQLKTYDTAADTTEAVNAYINAVTVDKVHVIVGPPIANIVNALKATTADYTVPMITLAVDPKCYADESGKLYEYLFCAQPSTVTQGSIMATYAIKEAGLKNIGVFYTQDNSYSVGLVDPFLDAAKELGFPVADANIIGYNSSETDVKTLIQPLVDAGVDAIYCPNYTKPLILIAQALSDLGYKGKIISGLDGAPAFNTQFGGDCSNIFFINNIDVYEEKTAAMIAELGDSVGAPNKYFLGYDSMQMLAEIIAKVGTDGAAIAEELKSHSYTGLTGTITMDPETHMPVKSTPMFMYTYDYQTAVMLKKYPEE